MVKEEQPSIFFSDFSGNAPDVRINPELFYSSKGGYSMLYRYDKDGKFRVLKALKPEFRGNPIYERLLKKEFEIGYELDHPNICNVYSFIKVEALGNCIEMEYIDGASLDEFVGSDTCNGSSVKRILCEICDALSYIHHKQIVHRDLKPQNILITHNGQNVKLIDFGLSDSDWHSVLKGKAGTREYAAPELLGKGEVDNRTDIYSLGKIIHLTGVYSRVARKCTRILQQERFATAEEVKAAILNSNRSLFIKAAVISAVLLLILAIAVLLWHKMGADNFSETLDKIFTDVGDKIIETHNR